MTNNIEDLFDENKNENVYIQPQEGVDFMFLDSEYQSHENYGPNPCVKILKGPYKNIVVKYGLIQIVPENPPRLQYNYIILDNNGHDEKVLNKSQQFWTILGQIITEVQLKALKEWKEQRHEDRNNPIEVIDLQ